MSVFALEPPQVSPLAERRPRGTDVPERHGLILVEVSAFKLLSSKPLRTLEKVLGV